MESVAAPVDNPVVPDPFESKCFEFLRSNNMFLKSLNFTENEVTYHWHMSEPYRVRLGRRGRLPAITDENALILLLFWLRHALDFASIAAIFGYGETATRSAILRTKEWLLPYLKDRWWSVRMRPRAVLVGSTLSYIGLVVDSTSVKIGMPGEFSDAKPYWDGKNKIYAMKKEVAVTAVTPHYALFSSPGFRGAEHDFAAFQRHASGYSEYLKKTPDEVATSSSDNNALWILLADAGYLGDPQRTPGIRKLALQRPSSLHTPEDTQRQQQLSSVRSCVERFFGRAQRLWGVVRNTYRLDVCVIYVNSNKSLDGIWSPLIQTLICAYF